MSVFALARLPRFDLVTKVDHQRYKQSNRIGCVQCLLQSIDTKSKKSIRMSSICGCSFTSTIPIPNVVHVREVYVGGLTPCPCTFSGCTVCRSK